MRSPGESTSAARAASIAFAVAGTVSVLSGILGGARFEAQGADPAGVFWVGVGAIAFAVIVWLLPWHRWPPRATMLLVVVAVVLIFVSEVTSRSSATADGLMANATVLTLLFVWIGLTQPRGWAAAAAPLVAAAEVLAFSIEDADIGIVQTLLTVALGAFVGELIAWVMHRDHGRTRDLGAVLDAVTVLRADSAPDAAAKHIAETAAAMLHARQVAVYLCNVAGSCALAAVHGAAAEVFERYPNPEIPDSIVARTRNGGVELLIPLLGPTAVRHGVVVAADGRVHDVFAMQLARVLADQAGMRLDDLARFRSLSHEAMRDALTGVGNRRFATALLDDVRPSDAIVLVDLDDLRGVNEQAGHAGGDRVLREVAAHLRRSVRDADTVARLGGDEFLVVFRGAGRDASRTVSRVAAQWNERADRETFSAGVAVHEGGPPEDTLGRADAALYRAKHDGRARIRTAPPIENAPSLDGPTA